jgi:TonB family protein
MNTLIYFLEANLALAFVALFYEAVLKNETHFQFQRWFLLTGIFCSLFFPFIQIDNDSSLPTMPGLIRYTLPELIVGESYSSFSFTTLLVWIYWIVCSLILLRFTWNIIRLIKLARTRNELAKASSDLKGSFSFLGLIFVEHSYSAEDRSMILEHEQVHARLFHSVDIILIEMMKIVFWFNPFVYSLKKHLTNIHEFQADEFAMKGKDVEKYCNLLARVALQSADFPIANHFNNSFTLTRIIMITKEKAKVSRWKMFVSALALVGLFVFVSCSDQPAANSAEEKEQRIKAEQTGQVYTEVQETATPSEGLKVFYEAISKTLVYPSEARQKGIQGKVYVKFIVNTDGTLSDFTVERGIGYGCDEAALNAVANSNVKWNPGLQNGNAVRQQMVVPINFQLSGYSENTKSAADQTQKAMDELVAVGEKK